MTAVDLWLNMALVGRDVHSDAHLSELFAERAAQVRRGVATSPRILTSGQTVPYTGYYVLHLPGAYELMFEQTSEASGLPLNKCAQRYFGCELFGPVMFLRRICHEFMELSPSIVESIDLVALRLECPRTLHEFKQARDRDETKVKFVAAC